MPIYHWDSFDTVYLAYYHNNNQMNPTRSLTLVSFRCSSPSDDDTNWWKSVGHIQQATGAILINTPRPDNEEEQEEGSIDNNNNNNQLTTSNRTHHNELPTLDRGRVIDYSGGGQRRRRTIKEDRFDQHDTGHDNLRQHHQPSALQ